MAKGLYRLEQSEAIRLRPIAGEIFFQPQEPDWKYIISWNSNANLFIADRSILTLSAQLVTLNNIICCRVCVSPAM